jgi:hypothetical protein
MTHILQAKSTHYHLELTHALHSTLERERANMGRAKLSKEEFRGKKISVRVNESELTEITERAKMCGVLPSEYLRSLSLNYPISSKVDKWAFKELSNSRSDLGRIGGLLKMWLNNESRKPGLDEREVINLLSQIRESQDFLTVCAKKLVTKE